MNEKMRVLEMLDNGKITAQEAEGLLTALGQQKAPFISDEQRENIEERFHKFAQDVNKFAKDVGCKVHGFYKDVEPKIKKASQTALEKCAAALDNLAHTIHDSIEKSQKECCGETGCDCKPDACTCDGCDGDAPKPN